MLVHAAVSPRIEKNTGWKEGRRDGGEGGRREGGESSHEPTKRRRGELESDAGRKCRRFGLYIDSFV